MRIKKLIVLASVVIAFNASAQEWVQMSPSTPPTQRYSCAMVYDSQSDRIVIFGGYRTNAWLNDVWEYDLNRDSCIQKSSLPDLGRVAPAMAYDSTNDKIILFGGYTATLPEPQPNSTWEYDLNTDTWTEKFPSNPPIGRTGLKMVYDSESKRIVMFGGYRVYPDLIFYNDTWVYDVSTNTWTEMYPDTSPAVRKLHVMVYDSQSDRIVLFGGESPSILSDTWEYDLNTNTWTEKSSHPGPSYVGYRCGMTYDGRRDRAVLFARPNDPQTWEYDINTDTWAQVLVSSSPPIRSCPGMAYDSENERVVLFGGNYGTNYYNDIWIYPLPVGVDEENRTSNITCPIPGLEVYPNPFSKKTEIRYSPAPPCGARPGILDTRYSLHGISINIYDASGRVVRTFGEIPCNLNNSVQSVSWDGRDMEGREVTSGVYFLKVKGCEPVKAVKLR